MIHKCNNCNKIIGWDYSFNPGVIQIGQGYNKSLISLCSKICYEELKKEKKDE